jgi:hypothetical protein
MTPILVLRFGVHATTAVGLAANEMKFFGAGSRKLGSHETPRWRELDSNFPNAVRVNLAFAPFVYRDNAKGTESLLTLRWREIDSNLYGAFPVKWLFLVLLRVLCSERQGRSSSRRLRSGSRSARKGSRDRNASRAWRLAA